MRSWVGNRPDPDEVALRPRHVVILGAAIALVTAAFLAVTGADVRPSLLADVTVATVAGLGCLRAAARLDGHARPAWVMLAMGSLAWAVNQVIGAGRVTDPGVLGADDLGAIALAAAAVPALLLMTEGPRRRLTQIRALVEGLMIAGCILFVSWMLLFRATYDVAAGSTAVARTLLLTQPLVQVAVIAMVVAIATRVAPAHLRWWMPLGAGLVAVVVADIMRSRAETTGASALAVLVGPLMGFALVAVAAGRAWVPTSAPAIPPLVQRLLTSVPSLAALGVLVGAVVHRSGGQQLDPAMEWIAVAVLCLSVALHLVVLLESDELSSDLSAAHDEAIQASVTKSHFLATVSHEIRTPMNAVIGLTGLLLDSELDEEQREMATGVAISAEGLLGLINDLLDFSKIEAEAVELEEIDLDLEDLVGEVGMIVAESARAKGLELVAYCDPELVRRRRGDPFRLRQILTNLASNAVKFTDQGTVVVRASPAGPDPDLVLFEVIDTGVGIAEGDRVRLFEPFSQADGSITRNFGGTGLGLAIVRRLTDLLGGTITIASRLGEGTTFRVTVPLPVGGQPEVEAGLANLVGLRALVVDGDAVTRTVLSHTLHTWGLQVDQAETADEALEAYARTSGPGDGYALALIDSQLEGMSGVTLSEVLRAQDPDARTSIFLLTSDPNISRRDAHRAGAESVLVKPVRNSYLLRRIVSTLVADPPAPAALAEVGTSKGTQP